MKIINKKIKIDTINSCVVKTIINNSKMIRAVQVAEDIGLLKKDINQVRNRNSFALAFPVTTRRNWPDGPLHWEYVYFTIPVNKLKHDLYRMLFNPNIKDGSLSKKSRAKVTLIFEDALTNLGIESISVHPYILKKYNLTSLFKAEINSHGFKFLVENERMRKFDRETAFISEVSGKSFENTSSRNEAHPRVYNMFTQMSSSIRQHVFKNIYGVDMVEIDLTNSIIQCLASRGKCTKILEAISENALLSTEDCTKREEEKEKLFKWIFSLLSKNISNSWITRCKNQLREFLTEDYFEEMESFIKAIDDLDSPHELFHYEDILREFCKKHSVCVNVHDAVYIPADRIDLIDALKQLLDEHKYYYKVKVL